MRYKNIVLLHLLKQVKLQKIFRNYQFLYPKKAIVLRINTDKKAACHRWFGKQLSVISP